MAKSFKVMIITPDKTAWEGEVVAATLPGLAGYMGIWANHAPLVGAVTPGVVFLRKDDAGSIIHLAVGTGFVEISDNVVNLMVDTCEIADQIDVVRAQEALDRARGRLKNMESDLDRERARLAASRADARVRAVKK